MYISQDKLGMTVEFRFEGELIARLEVEVVEDQRIVVTARQFFGQKISGHAEFWIDDRTLHTGKYVDAVIPWVEIAWTEIIRRLHL